MSARTTPAEELDAAQTRRLAAIGSVAASTVHDLNNVLNAILAAAYLAESEAGDEAAVRAHAQRITVAVNKGVAQLAPLRKLIRDTPNVTRAATPASTAAIPHETTDDHGGIVRVLLAEDDHNTRTLLSDLLDNLGHIVVAAVASGAEAIAEASKHVPDLVLLDVHMPDGSGIDAAREISRENPGIAVILFTGDVSLTLSERDAEETSAIAFLHKPTPPRVLDAQIRLAVRRARAIQEARTDAAKARAQLEQRKMIERAKGILMRRTGSSEQDAYRILQRTSQDRSVSMAEIAKAVIASEPGAEK